jgi:four helix bundle protein
LGVAKTLGTIERFEDIDAWQVARELTQLVYRLTADGLWARDFGLRDQIRRASVSIMSNIAEGFDRRGVVEFHRFLAIAKGSAAEVRSQLYVALDSGYITSEHFSIAYDLADKTARMTGSFMNYLRTQNSKTHNGTTHNGTTR